MRVDDEDEPMRMDDADRPMPATLHGPRPASMVSAQADSVML
jgi:hypothetical protein